LKPSLTGWLTPNADELHLHGGADGTEQLVLHLLRAEAARVGGVDDHDLVPFQHAALFGRRIGEDFVHGHVIAHLHDLHANAGIATVGVARKFFELLGRKELGVRIIELLHEPTRRLFVQHLGVERVHVPQGHERQHLVKQLGPTPSGARLQGKARGEQGGEDEAGQDGLAVTGHAGLAKRRMVLMLPITYVFDGALFPGLRSEISDPRPPRWDLEVSRRIIEVRWISNVRGQIKAS
jgi:hypothetical protein